MQRTHLFVHARRHRVLRPVRGIDQPMAGMKYPGQLSMSSSRMLVAGMPGQSNHSEPSLIRGVLATTGHLLTHAHMR